jgi:hypothetical protein
MAALGFQPSEQRGEDVSTKYPSSAARPETSVKKIIGRKMPIRILSLRILASRTGVEPVSPP